MQQLSRGHQGLVNKESMRTQNKSKGNTISLSSSEQGKKV